jgi:hypothetical protein
MVSSRATMISSFLCHQGLKLRNLGDLSVSIPEVTLRDIDQLTHTAM